MHLTLSPILLLTLLLPLPILSATPSPPPPPALQTLTLHHLPSSPTLSPPHPLALLTYSPVHPHLSTLKSFTPPANTTSSPNSITQIALSPPGTHSNHLTTSATATYAFHPPYKGRFRILVDPVTGEAVAASWHAWLPKSKSNSSPSENNSDGKGKGNSNNARKPGGRGDFDILTIKQPPPIIFDKPAKGKGGATAAGAGAGVGEGEGEVEEKTFLQKYWWVLVGVAVLAMTGGGGDK